MKKVLILGGTRYFGKILVKYLLDHSYEVTLLTRGNFSNDYKHSTKEIFVDRLNPNELRSAIKGRYWDTLYDQSCYSSVAARISAEVFQKKVGLYIFTSSQAVYTNAGLLNEKNFDETKYSPILINDNDYAENKRCSENIISLAFPRSYSLIRFPAVVGSADYLKRLHWYLSSIYKEESIYLPDPNREISLINPEGAATSLLNLMKLNYTGSINVASEGSIKLSEIIQIAESVLHKKAILSSLSLQHKELSPLDRKFTQFLSLNKLSAIKCSLPNVFSWLPDTLSEIALNIQ